ncbi:MAG: hypothetical protein D6679_01315 [Candidatus Hydrogenedentota bacterium]|nr:MAG: hypothetical protein D6679_01315 [Candidatus Hydrogenedentota bacterium]
MERSEKLCSSLSCEFNLVSSGKYPVYNGGMEDASSKKEERACSNSDSLRVGAGRKFATFREADEEETRRNVIRSPAENIALVLSMQERSGVKPVSLRQAARDGTLKVVKQNWNRN